MKKGIEFTKQFVKNTGEYVQKNPGKVIGGTVGTITGGIGLNIANSGVKEQKRSNDIQEKNQVLEKEKLEFEKYKYKANIDLEKEKFNFEKNKYETNQKKEEVKTEEDIVKDVFQTNYQEKNSKVDFMGNVNTNHFDTDNNFDEN